ncbi:MAG: MarR family winged helix-turn-helix transcriptional regulator [Actinomycetota bacterium]|nr:MarR family winged helix-turn-helix transcriptional regulator [Actinomycetota bacterium]
MARKLKLYAEQSLGANPGEIEAVPLYRRLILGHVLGSPGATILELSTRFSLAQSMVSTAVGALREQGLVITEVDPIDRRRVKVTPSERLQTWARTRLHADLDVVLAPLLRDLPTADQECVLRAFTLLNDSFRRGEEEGRIAGPERSSTRGPQRARPWTGLATSHAGGALDGDAR